MFKAFSPYSVHVFLVFGNACEYICLVSKHTTTLVCVIYVYKMTVQTLIFKMSAHCWTFLSLTYFYFSMKLALLSAQLINVNLIICVFSSVFFFISLATLSVIIQIKSSSGSIPIQGLVLFLGLVHFSHVPPWILVSGCLCVSSDKRSFIHSLFTYMQPVIHT